MEKPIEVSYNDTEIINDFIKKAEMKTSPEALAVCIEYLLSEELQENPIASYLLGGDIKHLLKNRIFHILINKNRGTIRVTKTHTIPDEEIPEWLFSSVFSGSEIITFLSPKDFFELISDRIEEECSECDWFDIIISYMDDFKLVSGLIMDRRIHIYKVGEEFVVVNRGV